MSLDICPCNICPSDSCPGNNCSSDTCPGSPISGVIDQILTTLVLQDCPNLVRIWLINTFPGNNCLCNICSFNICPGDIWPGNIYPSSHFSGTADQILVKLLCQGAMVLATTDQDTSIQGTFDHAWNVYSTIVHLTIEISIITFHPKFWLFSIFCIITVILSQ